MHHLPCLPGPLSQREYLWPEKKVGKATVQAIKAIEGSSGVSSAVAPIYPADDDWEELYDDRTGHAYWFNHASGETTWEEPHGLDVHQLRASQAEPPPPPMPPPPELPPPSPVMPRMPDPPPPASHPAAPRIPGMVALPAPTMLPPAPPPPPTSNGTLPAGWEAHEDTASGALYFFNVNTGETTWEAPQY